MALGTSHVTTSTAATFIPDGAIPVAISTYVETAIRWHLLLAIRSAMELTLIDGEQ